MSVSKTKSRAKASGEMRPQLPKLHTLGTFSFITFFLLAFLIVICLWVQLYILTADSKDSVRTVFKHFMTEKKVYLMVGFLSCVLLTTPARWIMDLTMNPSTFFLGDEKSAAHNPKMYYFVCVMTVMFITITLTTYCLNVPSTAFMVKLLMLSLPGALLIFFSSILLIALHIKVISHLKKYVV